MASTLLMEISRDEHERALFPSRKKAEMDRVSDLITVERRGRMEGIAPGKARGRTNGLAEGIEQVFELLEKGVSLKTKFKIWRAPRACGACPILRLARAEC